MTSSTRTLILFWLALSLIILGEPLIDLISRLFGLFPLTH